MKMWKLTLAYDGTAFHGWQVQPHLATIQGALAQSLHHLTGEHVLPQGSGRTDAGVHALAQVASFALQAEIPPANLLRALNRSLPPAIRVLAAEHADPHFHARHAAVRKTYVYRIHPRRAQAGGEEAPEHICSPMLAPYVWDYPYAVDLTRAHPAAQAITGTHDFTSFAAADPDQAQRAEPDGPRDNTRTIFESRFIEAPPLFIEAPPLVLYRVTGSGFLHHMVRNLVGTFLEIARGRFAPDAIPAMLAARNRAAAGPTAPPQGLFLHSVEYPA